MLQGRDALDISAQLPGERKSEVSVGQQPSGHRVIGQFRAPQPTGADDSGEHLAEIGRDRVPVLDQILGDGEGLAVREGDEVVVRTDLDAPLVFQAGPVPPDRATSTRQRR